MKPQDGQVGVGLGGRGVGMDNDTDSLGISVSRFGQSLFSGEDWKPGCRVQWKEHWAQSWRALDFYAL